MGKGCADSKRKERTALTTKEATKLIRIISTAFPSYKPQYDDSMLNDAIELWTMMFSKDDFRIVSAAVKSFIEDGRNKYAPSIGEIKEIMSSVKVEGELSEAEAWNMVLTALKNGTYHAKEEFDKLPEDIQRAIGSPAYLRELASSEDLNVSVESSNFYRNYRMVKDRRQQAESLPENVRQALQQGNAAIAFDDKQTQALLEMQENYEKLVAATYAKMEENYEVSEPEPTQTGESFKETLWKRFGKDGREANKNDET